MKKTKVITKLIAIILSILVVVQVAPMSTFAETIGTEGEKFEESGYSTEVSQEEEDPIVIGEDVDRRDSSNTKYFKMSDGTIKAAVYKDPVLYQDSAGKWQEIDNTLETSDNENDEISNFNGYATKSNKPYLVELLGWLQDMNWPGAFCILNRLQRYADNNSLRDAINICIEKARKCRNEVWEGNLCLLLHKH